MKNNLLYCVFLLIFLSCHKDNNTATAKGCNLQQVYDDNAKKPTITAGVWGTVSNLEGDSGTVNSNLIMTYKATV